MNDINQDHQKQEAEVYGPKKPTLYDKVVDACRRIQPELEEYANMGGFIMKGLVAAMDKANPELRREIFNLYIEDRKSQGGKLYSETGLLTRYKPEEFDLSDLNIDPRAMYEEAMQDQAYFEAEQVARKLGLGKTFEDMATIKYVEQQLAKIEAGEHVTFGEPHLYSMIKDGPGFDNPIGKKCVEMFLKGIEEGRCHHNMAEIAEEVFGDEEYLIERAKDKKDEFKVRAFVALGYKAKDAGFKTENPDNFAKAIEYFTQAIAIEPDSAYLYDLRAATHSRLGDWDSAIADYTKVIELDPEDYAAPYQRGKMKLWKDDTDGALEDFNDSISKNNRWKLPYFERGKIRLRKGDLDGAFHDFEFADEDPGFYCAGPELLKLSLMKREKEKKEGRGISDKDAMSEMRHHYCRFMWKNERNCGSPILDDITKYFSFKPTREHVEMFVPELASFGNKQTVHNQAGVYLSALMMHSDSNEFTIDLRPINEKGILLDRIGYELKGKKIQVIGDIDDCLAVRAVNSEIELVGNAKSHVGFHAVNSKVKANNVGDYLGIKAEDSTLIVVNAGNNVGQEAKNIRILVEGSFEGIPQGKEEGEIGERTRIFQKKFGEYVLVYPKS